MEKIGFYWKEIEIYEKGLVRDGGIVLHEMGGSDKSMVFHS